MGLHIVSKLEELQCNKKYLEAKEIMFQLEQFVNVAGLCNVGSRYHVFDNGGSSGFIILAESHISWHFWPEFDCIEWDVYVCDYKKDNRDKSRLIAECIITLFQPKKCNLQEIVR